MVHVVVWHGEDVTVPEISLTASSVRRLVAIFACELTALVEMRRSYTQRLASDGEAEADACDVITVPAYDVCCCCPRIVHLYRSVGNVGLIIHYNMVKKERNLELARLNSSSK